MPTVRTKRTRRRNTSRTARTRTAETLFAPLVLDAPQALAEARAAFGPRRTLARLAGLSERTLADLEGHSKSIPAPHRRRINELDRLRTALIEIMRPNYIRAWMETPNDRLGGRTPIEIVEHGEMDRLWALIDRVRSGEPT